MNVYRHTQSGKALPYPVFGLGLLSFVIGLTSHEPAAFVPSVILLVTAFLFWNLTITVDDRVLQASFGPGLITKKVPISEVIEWEAVQIRWWYGWGIHLTPYGWLYNISGWDAVIVTMRDGHQFCLGTDEPQELLSAIRRFASVR